MGFNYLYKSSPRRMSDTPEIEPDYEEDEDNIYINEEMESGQEKVIISHAPEQRIVPPLNFCPVERYLYRSFF